MSSDVSIDIRPEFNSFDHLRSMRYIATDRPWLNLCKNESIFFRESCLCVSQVEIYCRNLTLWRNACLKTWQRTGMEANYRMVQSLYDSSWRKMWMLRPRIQYDGLYVSRNTYIHTGTAEWQFTKTVNVVCYYRYLRRSGLTKMFRLILR